MRFRQELVELYVGDSPASCELLINRAAERQNLTPKTQQDIDRALPDFSGPEYADIFFVHIEAHEACEREVAFPYAIVSSGCVTIKGHYQGNGVLCYRVGRVGRHPGNADVVFSTRSEVDVVVAGAAEGDQVNAQPGELLNCFRVDLVVDEGANDSESRRHGNGIPVEP